VKARSFYIVRPSGERVRIEADKHVSLVDALDAIDPLEPKPPLDERIESHGKSPRPDEERVRTATLVAGEHVYIAGTLERGFDPRQSGYRDTPNALVMRPRLISTQPLADSDRAVARGYRNIALAMSLILLSTHGVYFLRYHVLNLFGRQVQADITSTDSHAAGVVTLQGYVIRAGELEGECDYGFYQRAKRGEVKQAPFLVAGPFHQLGTRPTEGIIKLVIFFYLSLCATGFSLAALSPKRPWWERAHICDEGEGRLSRDT
jgi:hypothetical protein